MTDALSSIQLRKRGTTTTVPSISSSFSSSSSIPTVGSRDPTVIFITVGTTRFDSFITTSISEEFANTAYAKGYRTIIMQVGKGDFIVPIFAQITTKDSSVSSSSLPDTWSFFIPCSSSTASLSSSALRGFASTGKENDKGIHYQVYRLKPNIATDIDHAGLIISHAGAGSIFESLRASKPLIIVINTLLMDNHQTEIAEALTNPTNGGPYLYYCEPLSLVQTLRTMNISSLHPLPPKDMALFVNEVDKLMGYKKNEQRKE